MGYKRSGGSVRGHYRNGSTWVSEHYRSGTTVETSREERIAIALLAIERKKAWEAEKAARQEAWEERQRQYAIKQAEHKARQAEWERQRAIKQAEWEERQRQKAIKQAEYEAKKAEWEERQRQKAIKQAEYEARQAEREERQRQRAIKQAEYEERERKRAIKRAKQAEYEAKKAEWEERQKQKAIKQAEYEERQKQRAIKQAEYEERERKRAIKRAKQAEYEAKKAKWDKQHELKKENTSIVLSVPEQNETLLESKIDEFVEIINKTGLKNANKALGKMSLSDDVRVDTYMKILIKQNKIGKEEAKGLFENLKGTKGFSSTLSKISGGNPMQLKGHLHELRLANESKKQGFNILEIGQKFNDGIKSNLTDADIIFQKNGKIFVAEVKNYDSKIPTATVLGDAESLLQYIKTHNGYIPVFFFTNNPPKIVIKLLERKNIQIIIGNAEEQAIQLKQLAE